MIQWADVLVIANLLLLGVLLMIPVWAMWAVEWLLGCIAGEGGSLRGEVSVFTLYRCSRCGNIFTFAGIKTDLCRPGGSQRQAKPRRGRPPKPSAPARVVGAALDMYFDGLSYRRTAENLGEYFDKPTDAATVYRWVQKYSTRAKAVTDDLKLRTGSEWVADELAVKVGGKQYWLFNVMDSASRVILGAYLSPERTTRAAATTLALARERSQTVPETIKTDGLPSYIEAVKTAFPTRPVKHVVTEGIRAEINNNLSERLQGTFRDRDKTLRAMKGRETGQTYIDGLVVNYNYFRPHGGLKGKRPAEAAGAEIPFDSWMDVATIE